MMLTVGTHLGPYEIVSAIGSGGMGEVYRAIDTNLGRHVAIKVLPDAFAHDPERVARFEREAKTLASLNHPHIAQVYGLEKSQGTYALVMELVEGEDLSQRIARGAIPLDEALPIARQIAEALEAAHEQGIIHRDLKPANIKVRPDGTIKVLDFGLAKLNEPDAPNVSNVPSAMSMSPTITSPALITGAGVLLGTAAYMAPDQAKGRSATKRSDIWAFGCLVYEMLTGRQAFLGDTIAEVIAAVLKSEPDWQALPATPTRLSDVLRRCLQKDPALRYRDIGDVRLDLLDALAVPMVSPSTAGTSTGGGTRRMAAYILITLFAAVGAGVATWSFKSSPSVIPSPAHLVVTLPAGDRIQGVNPNIALSPDGSQLAYVANRGGTPQLFLRALDSQDVKPLSGTEGAFNPFFSPDAQWIGFFAQGKMKKIPVVGGAAQTICDAGISGGATWGADDTIVFNPSTDSGLWTVPAAGGTPKVITMPDANKGEYGHRYPQMLPGGKAVIFTATSGLGWDESQVEILQLDTKERHVLVRGGHTGRFLGPGYLTYYRAGDLWAVPFDLARSEVTASAPIRIAQRVVQTGGAVGASYSTSLNGQTLAYVPDAAGSFQLEKRLIWVDRHGKEEYLPAPARNYSYSFLALSADGRRIAVTVVAGTEQIWIYDLAAGTLSKVTSEPGSNLDGVWNPDGTELAYRAMGGPARKVFATRLDGEDAPRLLANTGTHNFEPFSWSPDGNVLALMDYSTTRDIWMLSVKDHMVRPFLQTSFNEGSPMFSPDGRWIAYYSDESGSSEVYVQSYIGPSQRVRVSAGGGTTPYWNPSGRELFYRNGDTTMVVDVTTTPRFSAGAPRVLYRGVGGVPAADGQRFLAIEGTEPREPPTQIEVLLNWSEEFKRLVPTK